tara:strand:+ start:390 stop:1397 length:1008 start_codon:yes stop_codon:yes gene_type:complete
MRDLPRSVMKALAGSKLHARILDVYARILSSDLDVLRALLRNEACSDKTVRWMAKSLRGPILPNIGTNQRRLLRDPKIIEALINNSATPTPTVAATLETAIRNDLDLATIRNAKTLAEGFFGKLDDMSSDEKSEEELQVEEGLDEGLMEQVLNHQTRSSQTDAVTEKAEEKEPEPEKAIETKEEEKPARKPQEPQEEEEGSTALWKLISKMNMAQKVRLAMVGDINARKLLIRDVKRSVYMTVLRSPRLTVKEIGNFAKNKSLNEDIIRYIANNRDWTKAYSTKLGLIYNPKCPPNIAMAFVRSVRHNDLMKIARAKDVPAYVARTAKQVLERKQ